MAGKGTYSAYNKLTPYGDKLTETLQYWNEDGYKRRAEDREIEEADRLKKEAEDNKKSKLIERVAKQLSNYDTGSQSLNESQGRALQIAQDQYGEIVDVLSDPNSTQDDRLKAEMRLSNLHSLPEKMAQVTKFMTDRHNAYIEGKANGTVWEDPDYESNFKDGYNNIAFGIDERGNPVVAMTDTDGDGKITLKDKVLPYEQLQNGVIDYDFKFKDRIDRQSVVNGIFDNVGYLDKTTDNGITSHQIKEIKADEAKQKIKKVLYDDDGNLTSYAKSELHQAGISPQDENAKQYLDNLETILFDDLSVKADKIDKKKVDGGLANKIKNQQNTDAPGTPGEPVKPTEETWGDNYSKIDEKALSVPAPNVKIKAIPLKTGDETITITNAEILNYTYAENGDMIVDVVYEDSKGSDYSKSKEEELKNLIKGLNESEQTEEVIAKKKEYGVELSKLKKGAENKRTTGVIAKEDESYVAKKVAGSIGNAKAKAYPKKEEEEDNTNKRLEKLPE